MNQMGEKRLEVLVNGESIGEITMKANSRTTIVDGGNIISTGRYFMDSKEIENMIYKKIQRDYPQEYVETRITRI
jgi:hypothetical protein